MQATRRKFIFFSPGRVGRGKVEGLKLYDAWPANSPATLSFADAKRLRHTIACMSPSPSAQVTVIGAGPAGSVATIRLAQLGHHVTLFEKAKFPRDKVCGECVSAAGIAVLGRFGLADTMRDSLKPTVLRRAIAVATDDSMTSVDLPEAMWGVTRRSMDAWLAQQAIDAGATVHFETPKLLARSMTVPVVRHERDAHATPAILILADGRGASISSSQTTGDFGIKAHFRNVDADGDSIELVALAGGGYAGLAPVNGDLWNAAWSIPTARLKRHRGDIEAIFQEALGRSKHLRKRFARAKRVGEWLACPLPRHAVRSDWPPNVIPIGNAAAALEPVGGEGMGLAMRSSELAAEAIDLASRTGREIDTLALKREFNRLWRIRSAACRSAAIALSHPVAGPLAVGVANRSSVLARAGIALIGK